MVVDGKNGERLSLRYMREHSSAKAGEPLSLHVITTPSGSRFLPVGEQPLTLTIASGSGTGVPPVSDHGQDGRATRYFSAFTRVGHVPLENPREGPRRRTRGLSESSEVFGQRYGLPA